MGASSSVLHLRSANFWRPRPDHNVSKSWTVGTANRGYYELPELPEDDRDALNSVTGWNAKLKERGIDTEVVAVGRHTLKLT